MRGGISNGRPYRDSYVPDRLSERWPEVLIWDISEVWRRLTDSKSGERIWLAGQEALSPFR